MFEHIRLMFIYEKEYHLCCFIIKGIDVLKVEINYVIINHISFAALETASFLSSSLALYLSFV